MPKRKTTQTKEELEHLEREADLQPLPDQKKVFGVSSKLRRRLHNLPDPTHAPLGYDAKLVVDEKGREKVVGKGFDAVFPHLHLPRLHPVDHGDTVVFNAPDLPANQVILGDNLEVLRTLPSESIDLIYIDPPFFSGRNYNVIWGDSNEVRSFYDVWEGGLDSYLIWLNARLWEMRRVLKKTGSIYVHCDWHASHYIKIEMDKIFGYERLINEIIWYYAGAATPKDRFSRRHDVILWYSKTRKWKFNPDRIRSEYAEATKERFRHYVGNIRRGGDFGPQQLNPLGKHPDDVLEVSIIPPSGNERIGYPTQKPVELLQTLIEGASDPGDIIADFFCGGGTTLAVTMGLRAKREETKISYHYAEPRQFVGCDSSRIAIAVTLDRLVKVGEEMSGVRSNQWKPAVVRRGRSLFKEGEAQMKLQSEGLSAKVPNIEVSYMGVYPIDKFKNLPHDNFVTFVLTCYGASRNTAEGVTHGYRPPGQSEPVLVGPPDPSESIKAEQIKLFFDEVKSKLEPNKPVSAKVIGWRFSRPVQKYAEVLGKYVSDNRLFADDGVTLLISIELISLRSQRFREHVLARHPDVDEVDFLLRFPEPPVIGGIRVKQVGKLEYGFEAVDALSAEEDGWLVNCQWDFDYQEGHFAADKEYVLSRDKVKDKKRGERFKAVLTAKHKFEKPGEYTIACKVQDNLAGETIISKKIIVE